MSCFRCKSYKYDRTHRCIFVMHTFDKRCDAEGDIFNKILDKLKRRF